MGQLVERVAPVFRRGARVRRPAPDAQQHGTVAGRGQPQPVIGARPFTEWLPDEVVRDRFGFVVTGPGEHWRAQRPPLMFESSMPGVFAVGDVRSGSVKRVASAAGEGSVAIQQVHQYLQMIEIGG